MATLENRVTYQNRSGTAAFECGGCGDSFKCGVGNPGQSVRAVCECGREYRIRYVSLDTAEMVRLDDLYTTRADAALNARQGLPDASPGLIEAVTDQAWSEQQTISDAIKALAARGVDCEGYEQ